MSGWYPDTREHEGVVSVMAASVQEQLDVGKGFDVVAWLAPIFVGANELCMIHCGDPEAARSRIASSCQGRYVGDERCEVSGGTVTWARGGEEGSVSVKALVDYAAGRHDRAVGDALVAAYQEYVRTATTRYTLARSSTEYRADPEGNEARAQAAYDARRALDHAATAWWAAEPPGEQFALF